jgi:hypothetical protein
MEPGEASKRKRDSSDSNSAARLFPARPTFIPTPRSGDPVAPFDARGSLRVPSPPVTKMKAPRNWGAVGGIDVWFCETTATRA